MIHSAHKPPALRAPFDAAIWASAEEMAEAYELILRCENRRWFGRALEYSEAIGDGKTVVACVRDTRKALTAAVATMLEVGQSPPRPARAGQRSAQVNVRLTPQEQTLLESRARASGFRGLSDFIRTSVLAEKLRKRGETR